LILNRFRPLSVCLIAILPCLMCLVFFISPVVGQSDTLPVDSSTDQTIAVKQAHDATAQAEETLQQRMNNAFKTVNGKLEPVLFFDISAGLFQTEKTDEQGNVVLKDGQPVFVGPSVPVIVLFLLAGGVFFTFRFGFINFRLFFHSIQVIRGKYDNPDDHGEITHFQALTSALSATVGLGNIAGVALAISGGGPGAVFWMCAVAVFGMSSKFCSCTLAQLYRKLSPEGLRSEHVLGGPMVYLEKGMIETFGRGLGLPFGKLLAILFAFFTIMGALGGGNMFQANQTFEIVSFVALDGSRDYAWLAGLIMAALVGLVIVGGIKRIGEVTSKIVPAMCVFYCIVCATILLANSGRVPALLGSIFTEAFNIRALGWGGAVGIMVTGIKRGAFSNEAGLGSAAIAHSAARTNEPVREGVVAMIGPFIDTIVVCTMTALVILVAESQIDPIVRVKIDTINTGTDVQGAALTAAAFGTLHGFLPFMLCIAVFVFAYSTMISWGYYGERASEYLFGKAGVWPYRVVFLAFVVLGPVISLLNVKDFTDMLILSMAYPNIVGMVILSPKVAKLTRDYVRRLKSGQMKSYRMEKEQIDGEPSI